MFGIKSMQETKEELDAFLKDKLQPGENVVAVAYLVQEIPSIWWGLLTPLIFIAGLKNYRVVLTSHHLLLIELNFIANPQAYIAYKLSELKVKKVSGLGIFGKTLHLVLPDGTTKKLKFTSTGSDKGVVDQVANAIPKLQQ